MARRIVNPNTNPDLPAGVEAEVRPASTVMLIRDHHGRPQVFMVRRTSSAAFGGGMYVFPGGRVDSTEGDDDLAFVHAAIRECFEEAGVLLATTRAGAPIDTDHPVFSERVALHEGRVTLDDLLDRHGLVATHSALFWVARWVTPKGELVRRFDTRFYVAAMPGGQRSRHDDAETVASEWIGPAEALARAERGEMILLPPTIAQLEFLAAHATVASVMSAAARIGVPPRIEPKLIPGRMEIVLPGEPGYDDL